MLIFHEDGKRVTWKRDARRLEKVMSMDDGKLVPQEQFGDIKKYLVDPKARASVTWAAHVDDASGRHVIVQHHQRILRVFVDGTLVCELRNPSTVKFMQGE